MAGAFTSTGGRRRVAIAMVAVGALLGSPARGAERARFTNDARTLLAQLDD